MAEKSKNLIITGTQNREYDLEQISSQNRSNSSEELVVQIYNYKPGESPNPSNPKIGQIWLSRMVEVEATQEPAPSVEETVSEPVAETPQESQETTPVQQPQTTSGSRVTIISNLGLTDLGGN